MEIRLHVDKCTECAEMLKEEVAFSKRLSALPLEEPAHDVWPTVCTQTRPSRIWPIRWLKTAFAAPLRKAAAAAVAVSVITMAVYNVRPVEQPAVARNPKPPTASMVKWSDDPVGQQTDAMLDSIEDM